jgi:hypothetical protein
MKRDLPAYCYLLKRGPRRYIEFRHNGVSVLMKEAPE